MTLHRCPPNGTNGVSCWYRLFLCFTNRGTEGRRIYPQGELSDLGTHVDSNHHTSGDVRPFFLQTEGQRDRGKENRLKPVDRPAEASVPGVACEIGGAL